MSDFPGIDRSPKWVAPPERKAPAATKQAPARRNPRKVKATALAKGASVHWIRSPAPAGLPQAVAPPARQRQASRTDDLVISTDKLRLGMFVADLDRPWLGTPFAIQGFLVVDKRQIDDLQTLCNEVVIDRRRSAWYAIEHLWDLALEQPAAATNRGSARFDGLVATIYPGWTGERHTDRSVGIGWGSLQRWWERWIARLFRRRGAERASLKRLAGIPASVDLVVYRDTKPIEEAIGPARKVYRQIEAAVETFMSDLAEKREISAEAISVAASEMVESIAANSEAMMWLARMHAQNVRTYTHCVEVAIYMVTLGRHLGFPIDHLKNLCMTGLLLDVGLMRVDNALLDKAGPLTESERAEIRRHVDYSLDTLARSPNIDPSVREGIAQHHERIDGSGYPLGLRGEETSIVGRMAAIADTFAALTTHRPYADPESVFNAMKILFSGAGEKFHEPLVEQFVQAIGLFPVGSLVELSTGEVAAIVSHNKVRRLQPRVLILTNNDKQPLTTPFELNLLLDPEDADGRLVRIWRGLPAHAYGIDPRNFFLT